MMWSCGDGGTERRPSWERRCSLVGDAGGRDDLEGGGGGIKNRTNKVKAATLHLISCGKSIMAGTITVSTKEEDNVLLLSKSSTNTCARACSFLGGRGDDDDDNSSSTIMVVVRRRVTEGIMDWLGTLRKPNSRTTDVFEESVLVLG